MAVNLNLPSRQTGTPEQQLNGLYSYLYQLVEALNVTLNKEAAAQKQTIKAGGGAVAATSTAAIDTNSESYQQLKALIVKTASEVTGGMRKVVSEISEGYTAQSEYGTFEEYLSSKISAGADGFLFEWDSENRLTTTVADFDEYLAESGVYLRMGIVKHNDDGTIESGIIVGKNFHKVTVDGKVTYQSDDVYALFTADQISFWQSGVCFARLSLTGLVADQAYVDELIANEITAGNIVANMVQVNKLIASVIESEGGDASIALDEGLVSAIAKKIDLTANESIHLAVSDAVDEAAAGLQAQIDMIPEKIELAVSDVTATGLKTGSGVSITKDEVTINSPKTKVTIPLEGSEDEAEIVSIDEDGLRADVITADEIYSDSVVRVIRKAQYKPANGGELTSIIDELNDCSLKQEVFIDARAVAGAVIRLHGIRGAGLNIINGTLNGIEIIDCDSPIYFAGTTINTGGCAVTAANSNVELIDVSLNAQIGLFAAGTRCLMENCTGTTNMLVIAIRHSDVQICGETMPYGLLMCEQSEVYSTRPFESAPVIPDAPVITTISIPAKQTRTWGDGWLSTSTFGSALYQGATGGGALRRGCMWFDTADILGKHIVSATLTMKRVSGIGGGSAVAVGVYGTTATGASGTPAIGTKYGSIDLANGGSGTIDVTAAVQALADGSIGGLMIYDSRTGKYSGKTYTYGYCKVYGTGDANAPTLNVTYK